MKKILVCLLMLQMPVLVSAQNNPINEPAGNTFVTQPVVEMIFPILFMSFLVLMLVTLVNYFLEYRLKNKLIERGMTEQLAAYSLTKNIQEKKNNAIKLAILFCGLGIGLTITYLTAPINIHSLAIMAFSLGLSYLAYFFYIRK
ncbi:MAG: hypothetical protein IM638_13715 [Bacteroidetes bacterium]|nr:hypothetical protein [Bacteroidota bacterium]